MPFAAGRRPAARSADPRSTDHSQSIIWGSLQGVSGELLAILLIFVVHVAGAIVLIRPLLAGDEWRDWWPRDDDGDPEPDGGPPLPEAGPARQRLREPGRITYPRPARRPTPARQPERPRVPS
jgi:hypothetical protein